MKEFRLYKVYYMGDPVCWKLRVAQSPEVALTQCFDRAEREKNMEPFSHCCRAEEVEIPGYRIKIEKA